MRHQVPFVGERKVVRADDDQARAKRTSGRVIDDVVGDGLSTSSWDDIVPAGWDDKSQPKKNPKTEQAQARASVSIPKPHVPIKSGNALKPGEKSLSSGTASKPKPAIKTSSAYSGAVTFSDSASLDWISINNGRGLRVNIYGSIDHGLRKEWSRLLNNAASSNIHEFEFNLHETPALSLTGLGMLLLFKERKGSGREQITLCNCNKDVEQLLKWSGMEKYFLIQSSTVSGD